MLLCAHKYAQSGRLCYYVHTNMHNLEDYATMCTQICTIWKIMLLCAHKYAQSGRLCYYVHTNMHNLEDYATMWQLRLW